MTTSYSIVMLREPYDSLLRQYGVSMGNAQEVDLFTSWEGVILPSTSCICVEDGSHIHFVVHLEGKEWSEF